MTLEEKVNSTSINSKIWASSSTDLVIPEAPLNLRKTAVCMSEGGFRPMTCAVRQ